MEKRLVRVNYSIKELLKSAATFSKIGFFQGAEENRRRVHQGPMDVIRNKVRAFESFRK